MRFKSILDNHGGTPLAQINLEEDNIQQISLYAKLESYNPTGSVKDRAAVYIIEKLLELKKINKDTTLIESTSGNFGIALSSYCKKYGLKFCCVIDPTILKTNETLLNQLGAEVIKVIEPHESGGFLLNRIKKVQELIVERPNSYWVNQYGNLYNAEAYYNTLGKELCEEFDNIDYIFIGVSSGGTITGVSQRIKQRFPKVKVIAVDVVGSVIFGGKPEKRNIPGIGSNIIPEILKHSKIDEVVIVDEVSTVLGCRELLDKYSIFAGGSSGAVYSAIKKYFKERKYDKVQDVVALFPDRGDRYANTIFNDQWFSEILN
ncbi:2,3-diaminopropionate biosynthesis protein SbnA [Paenibacillus gorillae]|uniref:2,3-diaminopropionate biosynthesis protein SbnA n=1 Tax=Paenibacillus gorillae TaxID=1243662 RepID=UPI0004B333B4|nr:2,3-diaminopropionate biosynthesis protein SbnA [Paenibacillus gorillae]